MHILFYYTFLSIIYLSTSIYLSIYLSLCLSIFLSIYLSIYFSIFVYKSIYFSIVQIYVYFISQLHITVSIIEGIYYTRSNNGNVKNMIYIHLIAKTLSQKNEQNLGKSEIGINQANKSNEFTCSIRTWTSYLPVGICYCFKAERQ